MSAVRRAWRDDEDGAFPVFEAVIVAVLILTTIIFFTSLQRPTIATDAGGIDLGRLAADTMQVVRTRHFSAADCSPAVTDATLDEWVNRTMTPQSSTDSCMADAVEEFLDEVLPPGTRFQVRLDNGVEPMVLVPFGSTEPPRGAHAAEVYFDPMWRMNRVYAGNASLDQVTPGQEVPAALTVATAFLQSSSTIECIEAPNGSARAPDGRTWLAVWQDTAAWSDATKPQVPLAALYGIWTGHTDATIAADHGCTGAAASKLRVGLPAKPALFTADAAADTFQSAGHGLVAGTPVEVRTAGTLPAPLAAGTTYYVVNPVAGTFQVATASGGSALDLTTAGTGDLFFVANLKASQSDWAIYGLQLVVWHGA